MCDLAMTMKNRVFLITTFIIAFGINNCYANFEDIEHSFAKEEIVELQTLEIVNGDENGRFFPNDLITRAEFAKLACVILGESTPKSSENIFADVPENHWAVDYINYCYNQGLVLGVNIGIVGEIEPLYFVDLDENGNEIGINKLEYIDSIAALSEENYQKSRQFAPEQNISFSEALKILVIALGYEPVAEKSGYPYGYLEVASDIGISTGISFSSEQLLTRENAAKLIHNSLYLPIMISNTVDDENGEYVVYIICNGDHDSVEHITLYKKFFKN